MTEGVPQNSGEKLDIQVRLATPLDWKDYREIRLLVLNGDEKEMCGITQDEAKAELSKTDESWQADFERDLSSGKIFVMLSWSGEEVIGMGHVKNLSEGVWFMSSAYVKENFRTSGAALKMLYTAIEEIKNRHGKKAMANMKVQNEKTIKMARILGFKKTGSGSAGNLEWNTMELDLTVPNKFS